MPFIPRSTTRRLRAVLVLFVLSLLLFSPFLILLSLISRSPSSREIQLLTHLRSVDSYRHSHSHLTRKHFVAACVVVKSAGDLLHEFLIRNYLAGVDHFFLYDDNSGSLHDLEQLPQLLRQFAPILTINNAALLDKYLVYHSSSTSLIADSIFPWNSHVQKRANFDCFSRYGNRTQWMIPMDVDEFFEHRLDADHEPSRRFSLSRRNTHVPILHRALARVQKTSPVLVLRWRSVLSNGRLLPQRPGLELLSDTYPLHCGDNLNISNPLATGQLFCAKTLVQTRFVDMASAFANRDFFLHGVRHWGGRRHYFEVPLLPPYNRFRPSLHASGEGIYLLHYFSRSLGNFCSKIARGRAPTHMSGHQRTIHDMTLRERSCRRNGRVAVSESARDMAPSVRRILKEVEGWQDVQWKYFHRAVDDLRACNWSAELMAAGWVDG